MSYFCVMVGTVIRSFVLFALLSIPYVSAPIILPTPVKSVHLGTPELTLENVYLQLLYEDIKHPEVVLRQVIWETRWLKCNDCSLKFNNLFGFTTKKGLMRFDSWVDCVKFYKHWQNKRNVHDTLDYYTFLKKARFAATPKYSKHLQSLNVERITEKFEITSQD